MSPKGSNLQFPAELAAINDLPALQQLGQSLWRNEGMRGAAVLIGAGVSRSASLSGQDLPLPPLWRDLAQVMRQELYPDDERQAPADPLRLAEEYRTYFGQAALDAFIRRHIVDAAWQPTKVHSTLLNLPWSDVLTTNYDTLLERAAQKCDRAYDAVLIESDIAHVRAPRIVKLHGSVGSTDHFIIAEEDYRTYPAAHAAFVNLARQVFVENELFLLGFSGDDPNFLAWAGWVRDHLGSSARRIYLAGALNLGPAKRKFLEARNIAPIDVFDAVKHLPDVLRHEAATKLLVDALAALEPKPPHAWRPQELSPHDPTAKRTPQEKATELEVAARVWTDDRNSYPGWIVCPYGERQRLRWATDAAPLHATVLEALSPERAAKVAFELCWRHLTAYWPLPQWKADLVSRFADPLNEHLLSIAERLAVAKCLLQHAFDTFNREEFDRLVSVIEGLADAESDALADVRYKAACWACLDLNFARAVELSAQIEGPDPIWRLRRAAVLFEVGYSEDGEALIIEALHDLRERERINRQSLWIKSRLAWATFMARACGNNRFEQSPWPDRFRESRCDPWKEVENISDNVKEEMRKEARKPNRVTPNFEPGSFSDPSRTVHFRSEVVLGPYDELVDMLQDAGIPPRLLHVNFFRDDRLDALGFVFAPNLEWYLQFFRSGPSKSDALLDRYLSRVTIAALPMAVVEQLVERLRVGWAYWEGRLAASDDVDRRIAQDRIGLVFEVLGRLALRLDSAGAESLHRQALASAATASAYDAGTTDALGNLLWNSFKAIHPRTRPAHVVSALRLPLRDYPYSVDPVTWLTGVAPLPSARLDLSFEIASWIEEIRSKSEVRVPAITRLTYLNSFGALSRSERVRLSEAAWSHTDARDPPLPANSSVFPHFWTRLPAPKGVSVKRDVRRRLFEIGPTEQNTRHYNQMIYAARGGLPPTAKQAREGFDLVCSLRPKPVDEDDPFGQMNAAFTGYDPEREGHSMGMVLTFVFSPFLAGQDRNSERAAAAIQFIADTQSISAAGSLVHFLPQSTEAKASLTDMIYRGLSSRKKLRAAYATDALWNWSENAEKVGVSIPPRLVSQLIASIELRQSAALWKFLSVAEALTRHRRFNDGQKDQLVAALDDIAAEYSYEDVEALTEGAGDISLVRKQAVKLAAALQEDGIENEVLAKWRDIEMHDPLPEVRFARSETG